MNPSLIVSAMPLLAKYFLNTLLLIDLIMALGFGLFSWFFPLETFGTLIDIPEAHTSLILALFASQSIFYVLLGLVCWIGIRVPYPVGLWIGCLIAFRHAVVGFAKWGDVGKEWLIGNPYPDLIIHATLFWAYTLALWITYQQRTKTMS
ncbi:hypothetical protein KFE98_21655 [bacterium SCSIO 12741]|nr:hypothetical protein KFE98_21655 [bacterium SCSIO 12741]